MGDNFLFLYLRLQSHFELTHSALSDWAQHRPCPATLLIINNLKWKIRQLKKLSLKKLFNLIKEAHDEAHSESNCSIAILWQSTSCFAAPVWQRAAYDTSAKYQASIVTTAHPINCCKLLAPLTRDERIYVLQNQIRSNNFIWKSYPNVNPKTDSYIFQILFKSKIISLYLSYVTQLKHSKTKN